VHLLWNACWWFLEQIIAALHLCAWVLSIMHLHAQSLRPKITVLHKMWRPAWWLGPLEHMIYVSACNALSILHGLSCNCY
jgi:hypothetical protein